MKCNIDERAMDIARYIIDRHATVRDVARVFKISKSTAHKDIAERLPRIEPGLAAAVRKILDINKAERHIRGGNSTQLKYRLHKAR